LAQKNAEIAKHLGEALVARNKLYEANCEHTRELYKMKQQIKSLEEKIQASRTTPNCPSL